ncbi:unnamed protein product [Linum trigynum]|uniref:Uncharacterized protein n=1 Tax=Linum trigynum TaxID=586398 RepID=A0AAV2CHW1_9ROSI
MEIGLGGLVLISPKAWTGPTVPMEAGLPIWPNSPNNPQEAGWPIKLAGPMESAWPTRPRTPIPPSLPNPLPLLPRVMATQRLSPKAKTRCASTATAAGAIESICLCPKAGSDVAAEAIAGGAKPSPATDIRPSALPGDCSPLPSSLESRTSPQAEVSEVKQAESCLPESMSGAASCFLQKNAG